MPVTPFKPLIKQTRPIFAHRGHPLWRQCIHAANLGSINGFRALGGAGLDEGDIDFQNKYRAQLTRGGAANVYGDIHITGLDIDDGTTDTSQEFGPIGTQYDVERGWSALVSIRPQFVQTDPLVPFFKRRDQPYGAANEGWSFSGDVGGLYRVEISDGVSEVSVNSSAAMGDDILTILCATYDRETLRLYRDGVLDGSVAATIAIGNNTPEPIKYLGLGPPPDSTFFDGDISVGAVWARPLAESEVTLLARDPFIMWRHPEETLFAPAEEPGGGATNDICCCIISPAILF